VGKSIPVPPSQIMLVRYGLWNQPLKGLFQIMNHPGLKFNRRYPGGRTRYEYGYLPGPEGQVLKTALNVSGQIRNIIIALTVQRNLFGNYLRVKKTYFSKGRMVTGTAAFSLKRSASDKEPIGPPTCMGTASPGFIAAAASTASSAVMT
jgi:hypothetical protein